MILSTGAIKSRVRVVAERPTNGPAINQLETIFWSVEMSTSPPFKNRNSNGCLPKKSTSLANIYVHYVFSNIFSRHRCCCRCCRCRVTLAHFYCILGTLSSRLFIFLITLSFLLCIFFTVFLFLLISFLFLSFPVFISLSRSLFLFVSPSAARVRISSNPFISIGWNWFFQFIRHIPGANATQHHIRDSR